ncbi:MAG TPA: PEP-CTERM sorting domain-containing protein [Pirellulales bacterium]
MKVTNLAYAMAIAWSSAAICQAGWLGQTVTAEWYVPDNVTVLESHNLLVAPGTELPFGSISNGPSVAIDLSDDLVRFDFNAHAIWSPTTFNGWVFSHVPGAAPNIVGVGLGPMSPGVTGLTNAALSFTSNSVLANFSGVDVAAAGDFYTIKVQFGETPEPSSLVLAAIGGSALCIVARRPEGLRRRNALRT